VATIATAFAILYLGLHSKQGIDVLHVFACGVLLAVWIGFLLEDPAAELTASTPPPLLARRAIRLLIAIPVVWAAWASLAWYSGFWSSSGTLAAAYASQLLVSLGLAGIGARFSDSRQSGLIAAAGLIALYFVIPIALRESVLPVAPPATIRHLYGRWIVMGISGLLAFLAAGADPARRPVGARSRLLAFRAPGLTREAAG
jgi:hypothetical protein